MVNTKTLAIVFPGQGSQSVGMLQELAAVFPSVQDTFAEASAALGYDLWALVQNGPPEELNRTDITQPAMLAASVAVWRVWQAQGGQTPAVMAGHSLGEYTALVCAGAMGYAPAVKLVAERGRIMQEAVPADEGAMAAVLGLDDDTVRTACARAAGDEVVEAVNLNAPGQVVIAGNKAAVERALEELKAAGARRAVPLPVSVPSHCALMRPAAEQLAQYLEQIEIQASSIPVLHNVDVQVAEDAAGVRERLVQQLYSPVHWVGTVQAMAMQGIERIVECGPGKVLTGLNKRIAKDIDSLAVTDPASLEAALGES